MFNVQGYPRRRDGAQLLDSDRPPAEAVRPGMPLLTPRKLIETATITAARVLGLDDRIGSLTPGKRADIVLILQGDLFGGIRPQPTPARTSWAADQPARHRHR